jgi:hypothetical protein
MDTGSRWDGDAVGVRDKFFGLDNQKSNFRKTKDIIATATEGKLPGKIMFTFHSQRWKDKYLAWLKELIFQNVKNVVKKYLYVKQI